MRREQLKAEKFTDFMSKKSKRHAGGLPVAASIDDHFRYVAQIIWVGETHVRHVRFTPESRHYRRCGPCPLSAKSGHGLPFIEMSLNMGRDETIQTSTECAKSRSLLLEKHLETRHSASALVGQCCPIALEAIVDTSAACWHLGTVLKDVTAADFGHRLQFLHPIS